MTDGRNLWIGLNLLDRQLLDRSGKPVAKVDDVEIDLVESDGLPTVTALLCGPAALGKRFGPRTGAFFEALRGLLRHQSIESPASIPMDLVTDIGPAVKLAAHRASLPVNEVEQFLNQHLIGHIPGSGASGPQDHDRDEP
jgi:sporulation protein YlmC with PRC-barrel domain